MEDLMTFGEALRKAEENLGLRLDERISDRRVSAATKIDKSRLSRIIHGAMPTAEEFFKIRHFFRVDSDSVQLLEKSYFKANQHSLRDVDVVGDEDFREIVFSDFQRLLDRFWDNGQSHVEHLSKLRKTAHRLFQAAKAADSNPTRVISYCSFYANTNLEQCRFSEAISSLRAVENEYKCIASEIENLEISFRIELIEHIARCELPESFASMGARYVTLINSCDDFPLSLPSSANEYYRHNLASFVLAECSKFICDHVYCPPMEILEEWKKWLDYYIENPNRATAIKRLHRARARLGIAAARTVYEAANYEVELYPGINPTFFQMQRLFLVQTFLEGSEAIAIKYLLELSEEANSWGYHLQKRQTLIVAAQLKAMLLGKHWNSLYDFSSDIKPEPF